MTPDAPGSRTFYQDVVGWEMTVGTKPPLFYGAINRADGRAIGGVMPLGPDLVAQGAKPRWVGYITVDDVDASAGLITRLGGHILMPRMDLEVGAFVLAADPWGACFYIMTPNPGAGDGASQAFSPTDVGSIGWNEVFTDDQPAALAFYREVFGWEEAGSMDLGALGNYVFLSRRGVLIGAVMHRQRNTHGFGWNHYIRVANITSAHRAAIAAGAKVFHGPTDVPGGEQIMNGVDPQGATFAMIGMKGD
ncbi:VOC family protein [Novosphingobium sp. FSY-8]|uniref:VOC family protein n=1 Tax=Novosphingobium ovatum TaxID=1908523 RepID=A0ABW9XAW9_9SPHN|nr:VOC family protein [Novosphingobium ovatum]NBC35673.1 VOC family protein [Novosphingobium ovatum]